VSEKEKTNKDNPGEKQAEKGKNAKALVIIVLCVIVAITVVVVAMQRKGTSRKASYSVSAVGEESLRKGETRETLSPSLFADPFVASMYQAAKDIPQVFDSLKCYCFCEREPFKHVSLLSCFVDRHAEG
jgi:flagellar basal body-associated protein FliL